MRPVAVRNPLDLAGLLGRPMVNLDTPELQRFLAGKRVMVTGAGGSIGSEICRQAMRFCPERLLLVERAENSLFEIDRELRHNWVGAEIRPYIADVCDSKRMRQIFYRQQPQVVFHCAAHKHVPMMEANACEAIKNNVFGTKVVADASLEAGVTAFVLVSTDKAVNPTSVMGATKRFAELYVQTLNGSEETRGSERIQETRGRGDAETRRQEETSQWSAARPEGRVRGTLIPPSPLPSSTSLFASVPASPRQGSHRRNTADGSPPRVSASLQHTRAPAFPRFVAVRFGNVLGSSGSVVPIFQKQIEAGGPVTVTHPDMRRYFMTIPEASQLVMQAGAIGQGSEIFVLDMGSPVRIVELAHALIHRNGLRPGDDIEVRFTGIRPGEKLYEELANDDEQTRPTGHPKIRVWQLPTAGATQVSRGLELLSTAAASGSTREAVAALARCVPEYRSPTKVPGASVGPSLATPPSLRLVQPDAEAA